MSSMTLYYFDWPGHAEAARLMLTLGKKDFTDKRLSRAEWAQWKPKMPFGQLPVLEVDGNMLAQMAAIDHYCAAITGMLPSDPLQLAEAEQAYCFLADLWMPLEGVMMLGHSGATEEQQQAAWKEVLEPHSTFKQRMALLDKFLAARNGTFLAGDRLTYIDLSVFGTLSLFQSGWMAGMPRDILSGYPALKAFRHSIASVPAVAAYYAKEEDEVRQAGFRPDKEGATGTV